MFRQSPFLISFPLFSTLQNLLPFSTSFSLHPKKLQKRAGVFFLLLLIPASFLWADAPFHPVNPEATFEQIAPPGKTPLLPLEETTSPSPQTPKFYPLHRLIGDLSISDIELFAIDPPLSILPPEPPAAFNNAVVLRKLQQAFKYHYHFDTISEPLIQRVTETFLRELDPLKTLLLKEEVADWLATGPLASKHRADLWRQGDFSDFFLLANKMRNAFKRRNLWLHALYDSITTSPWKEDLAHTSIVAEEFFQQSEELSWCNDLTELLERTEKLFGHAYFASLKKIAPERSLEALARRAQAIHARYEQQLFSPHFDQKIFITILRIFAHCMDSHTAYFPPREAQNFVDDVNMTNAGIGVVLTSSIDGFQVEQVLPDSPAEKNKLEVGDVITWVENQSLTGVPLHEGVQWIKGKQGTYSKLKIVKKGEQQPQEFSILRAPITKKEKRLQLSLYPATAPLMTTPEKEDPSSLQGRVHVEAALDDNGGNEPVIALIRFKSFYTDAQGGVAKDIADLITDLSKRKELRALVIDLRNNLGGSLSEAVELAGLFLKPAIIVASKDHEGKIYKERSSRREPVWKGPLVILVNKASASSSEIVAGALQDYGRALIVGDSQTYGKGTFQILLALDDPHGGLKVTQGRYYTVSGRSPQLVGIKPDLYVPGALDALPHGESNTLYPVKASSIDPLFNDHLEDLPFLTRQLWKSWYFHDAQKQVKTFEPLLEELQQRSATRFKPKQQESPLPKQNPQELTLKGKEEQQLQEALHVTRDLLQLMGFSKALLPEKPLQDAA